MTNETPIKDGQHWVAKDPKRLKSTTLIKVLKTAGGLCTIERYYILGNKPHFKKDHITEKGLRRFYKLQHEQEKLL